MTANIEISRLDKELLIKIPDDNNLNIEYIQKFIDYIRFMSIAKKSAATEEQILELSDEINSDWWNNNKDKYIK